VPIFASQFGYANAYDPVGLDTGVPSVGATLGKATKSKPVEPESVGAKVGASGAATAAAEAAASAAESNGLSSSNGKAVANSQSLSNQGTLNKLTHMESMNSGAVNAANPAPETNTYRSDNSMFDTPVGPTPKEATVSTPTKRTVTPAASGGGIFHDIASGFDTARHSVSASTDWLMNTGGNPSSANSMGSAKSHAPMASTRSGVVEPSNVWNPTADTNMPSASGNGGLMPGVSSPSALAGSSQRAIGMNGAYNEQQFGRLQGARNAAQNQVDNNSEGIWGDIGNEAESWLEKASKVATSPEGVAAGSDD
jgi:hypothetical protein